MLPMLILMMASASFAQSSGKSLFREGIKDEDKLRLLANHFTPPPGDMLTIDVKKQREKKKLDPFYYSGSVEVDPPKGYCFTITRTDDTPDDIICQKRKLGFTIQQLDTSGRLTWKISTGEGDFPLEIIWPTPYRIAQTIAVGERIPKSVPLESCTAHRDAATRRIVIKTLRGESWTVNFPLKDISSGYTQASPNLYVASKSKTGGISADSSTEVHTTVKGYDPIKDYEEPKPDDPVTKHWVVSLRNSFVMNSSAFKTYDSPPGMNGHCRYRYKGAPDDKDSGIIECHSTDRFDVVMFPMTCARDIEP